MDTSLKTSKKIRLFFYRILYIASFFILLATAWLGREAFHVYYNEGNGILTGDIYYLPEFREYISKLYTYGLVGYIGAGDDKGYALSVNDSSLATKEAKDAFANEVVHTGEDIIYHLKRDIFISLTGNINYPLYSKQDGHLILPENIRLCAYWDGPNGALHFFEEDNFQGDLTPNNYFSYRYQPNNKTMSKTNYVIALKNTEHFTSPFLQELDRLAKDYRLIIFTFIISATLFLFLYVIKFITYQSTLIIFKDFSSFTGKIYLELKLLLAILVLYFGHISHLWCFTASRHIRFRITSDLWLYGLIAVFFYLLHWDIRHNGSKILRVSLIYVIFMQIKLYIKNTKWFRKSAHIYFAAFIAGILTLISGILIGLFSMSTIPYNYRFYHLSGVSFAILLIITGLWILYLSSRFKNFVNDTMKIADKLAAISNGSSEKNVSLSKNSLLNHVVTDISNVERGIEKAVEENLRANRMRVELITNVSHDLKTPLTSIINYSDLLCDENLSPEALEYARALRRKAYRLKGMVQDVFELSKATSGNLPLEIARLDLNTLIQQTLADMEEQIQNSSLTFKLDISDYPLMIDADGEKLYRIFQNLIVNALQYSLENSRVYIEVIKQNENACVRIKNISRDEMNFDPKEIVERFVRADTSRSTEGSGLGLSIVQSFTEACGGKFSIELNADLFTASVNFPLVTTSAEPDFAELPSSECSYLEDNSAKCV